MNPISPTQPETPEDRTERHLRVCQELVDLGMDLARAAARVAAKDLARQEAAQEPATPEHPPAEHRAPPQKAADPTLLFTRLCSAVRQTVALAARITTGQKAPARRAPPDPRRETLRRIFQNVTQHNPDRAETKRQTDERIDHDLALDPEGKIPIHLLFETIREDLAVLVDFGNLPDPLLDLLCPDEEDDENAHGPDPNSTFPPAHPNGTGPPGWRK